MSSETRSDRQQYSRWWKRLGWWLLIWIVVIGVLACSAAGLGKVFGNATSVLNVLYVGFIYGAATSPLMGYGYWIVSEARNVTHWIDDELKPWIPEGLRWREFWLVVIGGPAVCAAVSWDSAHTFGVLSMLAGIDAVLVVAVVVDTRRVFELVGVGGSLRDKTTLRLALLWTITFGTLIVANGAIIAQSRPQLGVRYGLVLAIALGYGIFALTGAVVVLTLNGSARIVEAHAEALRSTDKLSSPPTPVDDERP